MEPFAGKVDCKQMLTWRSKSLNETHWAQLESLLRAVTVAFVLCMLTFATAGAAQGPEPSMLVITEDSGPGNRIENGKAAGYNVEVVREILERVHANDTIQVFPWARGYAMLQGESHVALFSTTRTPEREHLFKWVGPTNINTWVLYKKKGSKWKISTLDDAKKVGAIGVLRDDAKQKYLVDNGFTNLDPVNLGMQNAQKLLNGRIDLWFTANLGFAAETEKAGISMAEFEPVLVLRRNYLYIAMSKDTPDLTVHRWQAALDAMKKDGTYKAILSRHPAGTLAMTFDPPMPAVGDAGK